MKIFKVTSLPVLVWASLSCIGALAACYESNELEFKNISVDINGISDLQTRGVELHLIVDRKESFGFIDAAKKSPSAAKVNVKFLRDNTKKTYYAKKTEKGVQINLGGDGIRNKYVKNVALSIDGYVTKLPLKCDCQESLGDILIYGFEEPAADSWPKTWGVEVKGIDDEIISKKIILTNDYSVQLVNEERDGRVQCPLDTFTETSELSRRFSAEANKFQLVLKAAQGDEEAIIVLNKALFKNSTELTAEDYYLLHQQIQKEKEIEYMDEPGTDYRLTRKIKKQQDRVISQANVDSWPAGMKIRYIGE